MNTPRHISILAVVAIVFGALTIFSGGRALFGGAQAQAEVGNAVAFVLWFNFLAGFAYVLAGLGLWRSQRRAASAAGLLALATALVALAFGLHVLAGGPYEMRTVGAMALRFAFWAGFALNLNSSMPGTMHRMTSCHRQLSESPLVPGPAFPWSPR